MISTFSPEQLKAAGPTTVSDELEKGNVVAFTELPIPLPSREDMDFLRDEMPKRIKLKNVSYHPEVDKITRLQGEPEIVGRTTRILKEHGRAAEQFLRKTMPVLSKDWTIGTFSFRPMEEKGRNLSAHASNELVHVDAGAYGASHGDRVLRFFVNINPVKDRVWVTKGAFPELYKRYGKAAGIAPEGPRSLEKPAWNKAYSGALKAAVKAGVSRAPLIDTSPFDRLMRRFHNFMKDTPSFQQTTEGHQELHFKPFSAWMVFTDMVSHACIEGQYAFIDTFVVPLKNCRHPELAPINILKQPVGSGPR